jgi:hypothetical protein
MTTSNQGLSGPMDQELLARFIRIVSVNRECYDRIAGAMVNLGYVIPTTS